MRSRPDASSALYVDNARLYAASNSFTLLHPARETHMCGQAWSNSPSIAMGRHLIYRSRTSARDTGSSKTPNTERPYG